MQHKWTNFKNEEKNGRPSSPLKSINSLDSPDAIFNNGMSHIIQNKATGFGWRV
jgi:hypothetical protein